MIPAAAGAPAKRSSGPIIAIAVGVGVLALIGVALVAFGAGAYFWHSSETASPSVAANPAAAPAGSDPSAVAAAPQGSSDSPANSKKPATVVPGKPGSNATTPALTDTSQTPAPPDTSKPATTAASSGGLKPIDMAGTQKKVSSAAAAATTDCAKFKAKGAAVESYNGSAGFRPDGTSTASMNGDGGSRECVHDHMMNLHIGKYAHPEEWHVESFNWSVTIK